MTRTCRCGKPLRGHATVCDPCRRAFDRALGDVPWLVVELTTSITRQRSAPIAGGPGSSTTPLPWDDRAARAHRNLEAALRRAVVVCIHQHIGTSPDTQPATNPVAMSKWLLWRVQALARHDEGPGIVECVTDAVTRAQRVVFWKPRSRIYLGPCAYGSGLLDQLSKCPGDVYADEGEPVGKCDECERAVSVVVRQDELDQDLHSRLLTAAEIADWAMRMGLNAKRDEVRRRVLYWHRHGRIEARGHDTHGTTKIPRFRYGDVRLLLDLEYGRAS